MINARFALTIVMLAVCRLAWAQGEATVLPGSQIRTAPSIPAIRPLPAATPSMSDGTAVPPRVIRGNDRVISVPKPPPPLVGPANTFRFEDAPLLDVVHIILRDVLKVDYVLHPPIGGSVTLTTKGEVSADQAVYLLEGALQANGIAMAQDSRGVYHVGRPDALRSVVAVPRQLDGTPLPPGYGAIVVPLEFIGAAEMAAILRPLLPPDSLIRVDTVRNLLVLAGNRNQAEGWLSIVSTFDVDILKGMSVGVFPLKYASVKEVEAVLQAMAPGGGARPSTPATPGQSARNATAEAAAVFGENSPLFGAIRIMPIERLNSILVVTPRAAYLEEAKRWIERLDQPGGSAAEQKLHVYPVQNGSARHLSEVLNGIFGGGTDGRTVSTASGVAPGLNAATGTSSTGLGARSGLGSTSTASNLLSGSSGLSGMRTQGAQTGQSNAARPATGAGALSLGALRVVADEVNNAILVYGTADEYAKIESTLKRLDIPPTQVLIEASIVEVTLTDDLQYGLQWAFTDSLSNGKVGTSVLSRLAGGVLGGPLAGFSYTLRNSAGNVRAVLNALADKSLVKVISSPSLMVLDNHTAQIVVGNQQPIRSGETITTGGLVSTSIQYKDTGVALSVTPSVNSGNMVTMSVNQAVTDVGQIDDATGQRAFLQRQIDSKVAVRSGETLVLGGLIRDNSTTGSNGLPGLHEIPLFGALFGTKKRNDQRTELLVIITPRVIRSDQDAREVSSEIRDRMKSFMGHQPFGTGGAVPPTPVIPPQLPPDASGRPVPR
jgi:general secretion pathway protein D